MRVSCILLLMSFCACFLSPSVQKGQNHREERKTRESHICLSTRKELSQFGPNNKKQTTFSKYPKIFVFKVLFLTIGLFLFVRKPQNCILFLCSYCKKDMVSMWQKGFKVLWRPLSNDKFDQKMSRFSGDKMRSFCENWYEYWMLPAFLWALHVLFLYFR